ncbi:MAG: hypothetical protein IPI23_01005 [Bacteroidetes bacterium]|nr:hypothetical protein [Bacteroidota bacterium]
MDKIKINEESTLTEKEYNNAILDFLDKHQIFYSTIGEIVEDTSLNTSQKLEAIIKYGEKSKHEIYDGPEAKIIDAYKKLKS